MDYQKRFTEIAAFLKPYQRIWQNEIMLLYPDPVRDYPKEWIDELSAIKSKEDVIRLEKKDTSGLVHSSSLLKFYERIEELTSFPRIPSLPAMPEGPFTYLHMIPKKQHEVKILAPLVNRLYQLENVTEVIDIGGGIGLLAQTLANQYELNVASVDMDPVLQQTGKERNGKNARNSSLLVKYHQVKVSSSEKKFLALLGSEKMTLGLHTCGPLANDQLRASAENKVKALINFGCCYQKLKEDSDQNLSHFAQNCPDKLTLNNFALTLSVRAHRRMNETDYDFKLKVKFFRYAIHILLYEEFGQKELITLGNSSSHLYDQGFAEYASEQLKRIGFAVPSAEELSAFYARPVLHDLIWKMLTAGLIRNALGRVLECYLLLDRVLYLHEKGYSAELLECFEESVSPRNLGIVARRIS